MTFIKYIRCPGMIFIQLFNWFHKFSSGEKLQKVVGHSQNRSKMNYFERGWRWFQLFFIDFQLFYFLTRIILDSQNIGKSNTFCNWGESNWHFYLLSISWTVRFDLIWFIVFNATFSNISAISWRPVLAVEKARENHRQWASNW